MGIYINLDIVRPRLESPNNDGRRNNQQPTVPKPIWRPRVPQTDDFAIVDKGNNQFETTYGVKQPLLETTTVVHTRGTTKENINFYPTERTAMLPTDEPTTFTIPTTTISIERIFYSIYLR